MDGKPLRFALTAIAGMWIAQASQAQSSVAEKANQTFLTGSELAEKILHDVVLIRTAENLKGAGFVIGVDGDWIHVATALHTLRKPERDDGVPSDFSAEIRVHFCAADSFDVSTLDPAAVYFFDDANDLAAFRIRAPRGFTPMLAAMALEEPVAGDAIWSVGREGECKIGEANGAVDKPEDSDGNIVVDVAGAFGGTSGSPVMTNRGIVGLVWSSAASVKMTAMSIHRVRARITSSPSAKWMIVAADNSPPATRDATLWELTKVLNDYVFTAKDMRDAFVKETYHYVLLGPIVDRYNRAIKAFNEAKDRHDGTLARSWDPPALQSYSELRALVESIHARMLTFNRNMEKLNRGTKIPEPIRNEMKAMSPDIDLLDKLVRAFLRDLKGDGIK